MANINPKSFHKKILSWFDNYGRKDLPWQKNISAYRVWVSEIMLQQTQVKTVIPYFKKFMEQFPNINALASADIDAVLHLWTGLGYYARARNLHKTATMIKQQYNEKFPKNFDDIIQLPGIGRSTAGAICSIAYKQSQPILDGNVKRVLARCFTIKGWPGKTDVQNQLWQQAEYYTPKQRVADYTQAMMDLGATVCTRSKPKCDLCPLQSHCQAYKNETQHLFPGKKPKKTLPVKTAMLLMIQNPHGEILLEKRPERGIWGGLWSFPECASADDIKTWCLNHDITIEKQQHFSTFRHTFSHYHFDIEPVMVTTNNTAILIMDSSRHIWYNKQQELGLAAPVKTLLQDFL